MFYGHNLPPFSILTWERQELLFDQPAMLPSLCTSDLSENFEADPILRNLYLCEEIPRCSSEDANVLMYDDPTKDDPILKQLYSPTQIAEMNGIFSFFCYSSSCKWSNC